MMEEEEEEEGEGKGRNELWNGEGRREGGMHLVTHTQSRRQNKSIEKTRTTGEAIHTHRSDENMCV